MNAPTVGIPESVRADVEALWNYHDLHHELRACDVGVGLGSHDLGVADHIVDLYQAGNFPLIVFTGANAPTTVGRFPRGEAVHYRERALEREVPDSAILVEPRATNTAENIEYTRRLLVAKDVEVGSILLVSRPYQQRRAFATAKKIWPEVEIVCSSQRLPLDEYVRAIGDADRVINMLVGDTQRITVYAERGFAIPQEVPVEVNASYRRLVDVGYVSRLVRD
ncbi:YdcF family protein [Saccharopolyspora pogona]|uniref:YdcF family protein n=1 Tax=Saccharopolyspora pogona TaxID=333966 RepID=UPI001682EAD9|nr:YdcF family protein [Saccharopolyspora pogona]